MDNRRRSPVEQETLRVLLAIACGTLFVAVSQIAGQMGTDALEKKVVGEPAPADSFLYGLLGGAVFVVVASCLYFSISKRHGENPWGFVLDLVGLALGFGMIVLSNAFPNWLLLFVKTRAPTGDGLWWLIFVLLSILWCFLYAWIVPRVQGWFQTPFDVAADVQTNPPPGASTLIILVSRIDETQLDRSQPAGPWHVTGKTSRHSLYFKDLKKDIDSLDGSRWPWQQLLRSVNWFLANAQVNHLTVILVGSRDVAAVPGPGQPAIEGSFKQLKALCVPFLTNYGSKKLKIEVHEPAVDFENFNDVKESIRRKIVELCEAKTVEEHVFVDITGGLKVASAAAACATIGTHGRFLYVNTNNPDDMVVSDLQPAAAPMA